LPPRVDCSDYHATLSLGRRAPPGGIRKGRRVLVTKPSAPIRLEHVGPCRATTRPATKDSP
jgi:hypothetical protein